MSGNTPQWWVGQSGFRTPEGCIGQTMGIATYLPFSVGLFVPKKKKYHRLDLAIIGQILSHKRSAFS